MKGDDVELADGATSLYPQEFGKETIADEWALLGAIIDRIFLIAYGAIFVLNMFSFISVL